jgi:hypothetical protein
VQDEGAPPKLKIAPRVTRKHGETFADEWLRTAAGGEDVWDAFAETGLMQWPEDDPNRPLGQIVQDPRQARYHDIEDEILERVFASVRPAVAEEFVKVAGEVLARERKAPALKIAPRVTRKHGEVFAAKWIEQSLDNGAFTEASATTGVIEWPGYDPVDESIYTPAQQRCHAIHDEIIALTARIATPAIANAFVKAARTVLARERRRQK